MPVAYKTEIQRQVHVKLDTKDLNLTCLKLNLNPRAIGTVSVNHDMLLNVGILSKRNCKLRDTSRHLPTFYPTTAEPK